MVRWAARLTRDCCSHLNIAGEGLDADVGQAGNGFADELHPFGQRKDGLLFRVDANADDDRVEDSAGPLDDVEMTEGDRVERSGVDGGAAVGGVLDHGGEGSGRHRGGLTGPAGVSVKRASRQ